MQEAQVRVPWKATVGREDPSPPPTLNQEPEVKGLRAGGGGRSSSLPLRGTLWPGCGKDLPRAAQAVSSRAGLPGTPRPVLLPLNLDWASL